VLFELEAKLRGNSTKCVEATIPEPNLPPDLAIAWWVGINRVGEERLDETKTDGLDTSDQGFMLRLASPGFFITIFFDLACVEFSRALRHENGR
jgi:hypothetical protein